MWKPMKHSCPCILILTVMCTIIITETTWNLKLQEVFRTHDVGFLFSCGYLKPDDKETLLKTIWLHYVYFHPYSELQQLRKGTLDMGSLGSLVALYPEKIFSLTYEMTADKLSESFVVSFSESGSNDRTKEETVVECKIILTSVPSFITPYSSNLSLSVT